MELMGKLARVREDEDELRGCAHHALGDIYLQQFTTVWTEEGDRALGHHVLEVEDDGLLLGASSSNFGKVDGAMVEQLTSMLQQQDVLLLLLFLLFFFFLLLSSSLLSFLYSLLAECE